MLDVDALAQEIRRVDGSHSLGAGELAEALMPFIARASSVQAEPAVADENKRLRAVISKVCDALPNGAFCSPNCSVEFMELVPGEVASVVSALVATPPAEQHPDDIAVDRFAEAMKAKLKWERNQRERAGWQTMSAADLSRILYEHLPKGDPVDVANLSMMLHQNGQQIETPPAERVVEALPDAQKVAQAVYHAIKNSIRDFEDFNEVYERIQTAVRATLAAKPAVKDDETVVALRNRVDRWKHNGDKARISVPLGELRAAKDGRS